MWGTHSFKPHAVVQSVADAQGLFDYIVVCSKASVGVTPSAAELIKPAVGPETTIVLCQNGIGIEEEYHALFPGNTIISGVVYLPVTQIRQGYVIHGELETLEIGLYPANPTDYNPSSLATFTHIFSLGGGTIRAYPDVQERRWTKLITNSSWNPITALSKCSDAAFLRSSPLAQTIVHRAMLEVVAVTRAKGYDAITEATADWQLSRAVGRLQTKGKEPSMLTDVREGRLASMEVEPIVGSVVRFAAEVGMPVPTLETIYVLIKGLSVSEAEVGR